MIGNKVVSILVAVLGFYGLMPPVMIPHEDLTLLQKTYRYRMLGTLSLYRVQQPLSLHAGALQLSLCTQ